MCNRYRHHSIHEHISIFSRNMFFLLGVERVNSFDLVSVFSNSEKTYFTNRVYESIKTTWERLYQNKKIRTRLYCVPPINVIRNCVRFLILLYLCVQLNILHMFIFLLFLIPLHSPLSPLSFSSLPLFLLHLFLGKWIWKLFYSSSRLMFPEVEQFE